MGEHPKLRCPTYLSYSAMKLWFKDRQAFVKRYIAPVRIPRDPQGLPASVGSAFDAEVKAELYEHVYGKNYMPEKYSRDALFAAQVEPANRDFADPAGKHVLECYRLSGMLDRIKAMCDRAIEPPRFEDKLEDDVNGVTLLGYSDMKIRLPEFLVIGDWKVNGYCSNSTTSPNKGYTLLKDGYEAPKQSKNHGRPHKDSVVTDIGGLGINATFMEDYQEDWATQTSGYAWMYGEEVGSEDWVALVHQITAKPIPDSNRPLLKCSEYVSRVRKPFQQMKHRMYKKVWDACQSGHFFDELSREESDIKTQTICDSTGALAKALETPDSNAGTFMKIIQKPWYK